MRGLENCLIWVKTSKRELEQARTRAEGLEVFEIGAWQLRKGFECENASRNEVGGQKLRNKPQRGQKREKHEIEELQM